MSETDFSSRPAVGFFRRLGGWVYDLLVGAAVWMLVGFMYFLLFALVARTGILGQSETGHLIDLMFSTPLYKSINLMWNVFWLGAFFAWFWYKGGQTLGMRAWRLKLVSMDGKKVTKRQAIIRALTCFGGLGSLLSLFDIKHHHALQDRLSGTKIILLSREENLLKNWQGI